MIFTRKCFQFLYLRIIIMSTRALMKTRSFQWNHKWHTKTMWVVYSVTSGCGGKKPLLGALLPSSGHFLFRPIKQCSQPAKRASSSTCLGSVASLVKVPASPVAFHTSICVSALDMTQVLPMNMRKNTTALCRLHNNNIYYRAEVTMSPATVAGEPR